MKAGFSDKVFLITGATGFIGSEVVERLLEFNCRVIGVGRKAKGCLSDKSLSDNNFKFIQTDLSKSFNELAKEKIDVIIHLASQPPSNDNFFEDFLNKNVVITKRLVNFAKDNHIGQFVFSSSGSIFGKKPKDAAIDENTVPEPINYYGLSKYIEEKIIEIELTNCPIQSSIIRFPSVFGKNNLSGLVHTLCRLAINHEAIEIFSRGERYRTFLYVDDAVNIILKIIEERESLENLEVFNAGGSNSLTMLAIAETIKTLLKSKSEIKLVETTTRYDWDVFIDIGKINNVLNLEVSTIEDGIEKYLDRTSHEV